MSDEEDEYVLYRHRSEWSDVKPIPQEESSSSVVQIAYSEKFKDAYDYFRAILASGEKSERALELTKTALALNPANYTVWQYRREILKFLKKDLNKELDFIAEVIFEQQKNYQVWHHRKALVELTGDASKELQFTNDIIVADEKNYHAWQHRQWAIKRFGLWKDELSYTSSLLEVDFRNNSAWNQRYFVLKHTSGFTEEVVEKEIVFTLNKLNKALNNESGWNYLRGILRQHGLNSNETVKARMEEWRSENIKSPQFLAFVVDMLIEQLEIGVEEASSKFEEIENICDDLIKVDTVRRKYWEYVVEKTKDKFLS